VPFDFNQNGWSIDRDKVENAVTTRTKAMFIHSPGNPTGWMADHDCLSNILATPAGTNFGLLRTRFMAGLSMKAGRHRLFMMPLNLMIVIYASIPSLKVVNARFSPIGKCGVKFRAGVVDLMTSRRCYW